MLPLGYPKKRRKYEKEKHNYFGWAVYPSSQVLFTECVGNHFRPQNNFHHKLNTHYKRPHPSRLAVIYSRVRNVNYFLSKSLRTASLGELNGFIGRMTSFLCGITPTNLYPHIGRKVINNIIYYLYSLFH